MKLEHWKRTHTGKTMITWASKSRKEKTVTVNGSPLSNTWYVYVPGGRRLPICRTRGAAIKDAEQWMKEHK